MIQIGIDFGMENIKVSTCTDGRIVEPFDLDSNQGATSIVSRNIVYYQMEENGQIQSYFFGSREAEKHNDSEDYIRHIKRQLQKEKWERTICNGSKVINAESVTADILTKVHELVAPNQEVQAVMTVPVNFSEYQKKKLLFCAKEAKIDVVDVLTEPMASLFSPEIVDIVSSYDDEKNIIVFDFGGSTLDICLSTISKNKDGKLRIENVASTGVQYGGVDITEGMFEQLVKPYFEDEIRKLNFSSQMVQNQLCNEIEKAKKVIYQPDEDEDTFGLVEFGAKEMQLYPRDFDKFLTMNEIDKKIRNLIELLLKASDIEIEEVDEVFMIGGTSNITFFQNLIRDIFDNDDILNRDILYDAENIYNSVANGAANFMVCYDKFEVIRRTSMSIGIDRGDGYEIVLNKNATYGEKSASMPIPLEFLQENAWKLRLYQSVSDSLKTYAKYTINHPDVCFAGTIRLNEAIYWKDREIKIEISVTPEGYILDTYQCDDKGERRYIERIVL